MPTLDCQSVQWQSATELNLQDPPFLFLELFWLPPRQSFSAVTVTQPTVVVVAALELLGVVVVAAAAEVDAVVASLRNSLHNIHIHSCMYSLNLLKRLPNPTSCWGVFVVDVPEVRQHHIRRLCLSILLYSCYMPMRED